MKHYNDFYLDFPVPDFPHAISPVKRAKKNQMADKKASFYRELLHHLANYEGINDWVG